MTTTSINYSSVSAWTAMSITVASLATSGTLVAGRQSAVIDNTSTKYDDIIIVGQVMTGASPTAGVIACYLFEPIGLASSTFTYPQAGTTALVETDAAAAFDAEQKNGALVMADSKGTNATSNRAYSVAFSVNAILGHTPEKVGVFLTHSTVVNLNATPGNHWFQWYGIKHDAA